MAENLPINFPIPNEGAIASYDWFDFATGAGYKTLYCVGTRNSTDPQYILSTVALESDAENQDSGALGAGTTNFDFELTFGRSVTIANADCYARHRQYTSVASSSYVTWTVYHVTTGGTATSIGSGVGDTGSATSPGHKKMVKFTLTKKSFGVGEKLRVRVAFTSNGSSNTLVFDDGTGTNETYIKIPFLVQP